MAKEVIDEIKKAEKEAKKIVDDAKKSAQDIITRTIEDNKKAYDLLCESLRKKHNEEISIANQKAESDATEFRENAYAKAKNMADDFNKKSDFVIEKIMQRIIM